MSTISELKNQILNANALGRANLAEKGVVVSEDATTYDIMQSIADCTGGDVFDSEGVTFGYEKKTVTNTVEVSEGKCFYSGVKLPEIPADVLVEYPYCWIRDNASNALAEHYELFLAKGYWYYNSDCFYTTETTGGIQWYRIEKTNVANATEWTFYQSYTDGNLIGCDSNRTALWSNNDIPNGSATATEIYFKGTEAVISYTTVTTTETVNAPVEREERYSITSDDLNNIAKRTQEMAGTSKLLTTKDIIYWLGRVAYIPQGRVSDVLSLDFDIDTIGTLPVVAKGYVSDTLTLIFETSAV